MPRRTAAVLLAATCATSSAAAQQRQYVLELSTAGSVTSFDANTNLDAGMGGVGRLGLWLPLGFSLEAEAGYSGPKAKAGPGWKVWTLGGALLKNFPLGGASSFYLKGGYGSTHYDNSTFCPGSTVLGPCGSAGTLIGGAGARIALSPVVMLRVEGDAAHGGSSGSGNVTNFSGSVGLSLMLASRKLVDSDADGVYDRYDKCPATPRGALVDRRGCPTDTDSDGVYDGLDRCPNTPRGVKVDSAGCPVDGDSDGVPDGLDRCPNTPAGAAVDRNGCPVDSDSDGVPDGLDRCPNTPHGATVDQLGCPGDEDGDGVLDGLDRCPHTPPGTPVDAVGCPAGAAVGEKAGALSPGPIPGVVFGVGSAALGAGARPALDSLARLITQTPAVVVELHGHSDGSARDSRTVSLARADAVRRYLIGRGVPATRLVAIGDGATAPLARGTSAAARAANRRVEVRLRPAGTGR